MVFLFEGDTREGMKERASLELSPNIILAVVFLLAFCEYPTLIVDSFAGFWLIYMIYEFFPFWIIVESRYFGRNLAGLVICSAELRGFSIWVFQNFNIGVGIWWFLSMDVFQVHFSSLVNVAVLWQLID